MADYNYYDVTVPYTCYADVTNVVAKSKEDAERIAMEMVIKSLDGEYYDGVELNNSVGDSNDINEQEIETYNNSPVPAETNEERQELAESILKCYNVMETLFFLDESIDVKEIDDEDEEELEIGEAQWDEYYEEITARDSMGRDHTLSELTDESQEKVINAIINSKENIL